MDRPMVRTFIGCYIYVWAQTHSIYILTIFTDGPIDSGITFIDGPMVRTFIGCYIYAWAQTHSIHILTIFTDGPKLTVFISLLYLQMGSLIKVLHLWIGPWSEHSLVVILMSRPTLTVFISVLYLWMGLQ